MSATDPTGATAHDMLAVRYDAIGGTPALVRLPRPQTPPDGALIAVRATGVCRSDWHAWQGHDPVELPHVPGHELVGEIAELGSHVGGFTVGERVTTPFVCGCGRCEFCLAGQAQVCPEQTQPGFTGPGSFAEYVVVRAAATNLVRLPDDLGDVEAAVLGCRFATSYRALTAHARVEPGQWVSVHGCGGVGLSAVVIAASFGARVLAVDVDRTALRLAAELGADSTADVSGATPAEVGSLVRDRTGGGAHVSVDALGDAAVLEACLRGLRRRGRHVQIGLIFGDAGITVPMPLVIAQELEIYGSHGMAARDYPPMLALAATLDLRRLVGRVIGLDEAPDALMSMGQTTRSQTGTGQPSPGVTVIRL